MRNLTIPLGVMNPNLLHAHLIETVTGFYRIEDHESGIPMVTDTCGKLSHNLQNIMIAYADDIEEGSMLSAIAAFQEGV